MFYYTFIFLLNKYVNDLFIFTRITCFMKKKEIEKEMELVFFKLKNVCDLGMLLPMIYIIKHNKYMHFCDSNIGNAHFT